MQESFTFPELAHIRNVHVIPIVACDSPIDALSSSFDNRITS